MGRIAIAGSSGLVGTRLSAVLAERGHEVIRLVRRNPTSPGERRWDPASPGTDDGCLDGCDAVVNLAGRSIASGPWTPARRKAIRESRVAATRHLARECARCGTALVNASAVGFYGDRLDEILDESSVPGGGFLADTCVAWEAATKPACAGGVREVRVRFGTVLDRRGGALAAVLPLFRLGLGARLGSGRQWISWIHLDDAAAVLARCLEDPSLSGPVVAASPLPRRQGDYARTLGRALRRPVPLVAPSWALRLTLGDLARELLLSSQRCRPRALEDAGFRFSHPLLEDALEDLLRR
jgi:uncharacterized protein